MTSYQDDDSEGPLAKTVSGEKSVLTFDKIDYDTVMEDYPLLAKALLKGECQVVKFQWRVGSLDPPRGAANDIGKDLPDEYRKVVSNIIGDLYLAAETMKRRRERIINKERKARSRRRNIRTEDNEVLKDLHQQVTGKPIT